MFTKFNCRKRIRTRPLPRCKESRDSVSDRQERIPGFNQEVLNNATGVLIGAGGIGSEIGEGLTRKGISHLKIFDHDKIDLSNLNRQLFFKKDLDKKKGKQLAINLAPHSTCGTLFDGYGLSFEDALALNIDVTGDFVICGVDNAKTRVEVSKYYQKLEIPVIFIAVDYVAEHGHIFVQESKPGKACFGCKFPKTMYGRKAPCKTPACKDILKVMGGLCLYAVDTLIMERKRSWNFRNLHLAGFAPSEEIFIQKLADCPLCNESQKVKQ